MAKYLVTGGAGFIGSHLVEALINLEHDVIVLDNLSNGHLENIPDKASFVNGDVLDASLLDEIMPTVDACFHLAAIPSVVEATKNWVKTHQINVTGTVNILNAARPDKLGRQIPVIFASSCAVYGESQKTKLKEADKIMPISAYGADKLASELHAYVAFHQFNIPTVCLRLFNVYGARQDSNSPYSGVISIFAEKLRQQQPVTIFGDGKQSRDFTYVKDIIDILIKAGQLKHQSALVINACTGKTTTVEQLLQTMSEVMQQKVDINYKPPRSSDVYHSCGDPVLAQKVLEFSARYSLKDGLIDYLQT